MGESLNCVYILPVPKNGQSVITWPLYTIRALEYVIFGGNLVYECEDRLFWRWVNYVIHA